MDKTFRKLLALLLIGMLCMTMLTACGGKKEEPDPKPVDPADPVEPEEIVYTIDNIRDYVIGVDELVELEDGTMTPLINFDNAATTPPLKPVMDFVDSEMRMYGSIGRGFSQKSNHSTDFYEMTRETVMNFVNADPNEYVCFYVNTTTDGLNKLASAVIESEDDLVLCTRMEHHANDLPWRERCNVIYAEVDEMGRVIYDDIERLLTENEGKVKYVCVSAASNITGYVNDVHRVAKMAHAHGAKIVVDGAQIVAHRKFSMMGDTPEENIDFFVFSAHKMYSPYGGGAVIGLYDVLSQHMPEFYGGGIVNIVTDYEQTYKNAPTSYEAGSPNYAGVVGMAKAMEVLNEVGFDAISEHEQKLLHRAIDGLNKIDNVIIYGDWEHTEDRVGVITFNFEDLNSYYVALRLTNESGVATRRGAFCAHPYVWRLMGISDEEAKGYINCMDMKTPGMIRISFGIYNTEEEVDQFLVDLNKVVDELREQMLAEPEHLMFEYPNY